ncbi:MAG TPA: helicase HerA-like domain-containing protein [Ilumatobacteraceae bacterium]|nr:helicase HerA-like domain-containing protein [Ilumatobacteraceae bacterium]
MPDLFLGGAVDPTTHERLAPDASGHTSVRTSSLTTHGVIVGMTGSGKTGLGVVLIEEALRAGLPVLAIDPKGDLTNLCLTFPDLAPSDFRPWIDEAQARNAGESPDEFATSQAALWSNGLAGWTLSGSDIAGLRAATDFTIYTPGSEAGVPLNIVGSLQVPGDLLDAETVADEIEGYVTGLLGLVGVDADPLASREHILLSNLISHSWSEGRPLDLMSLVGMVPSPPIRKLGVFDVDQFFPADARMALAMKLNGLLASPSFASWAMGAPLDIQSMLYTPDGRGRCAIVTTAHLSDEERQFVTSLVLSKLVTWMRRQSGTTDLRAMLYMDEVAGYLPPTATPPTKKPIMLLMKQARAFGVGVVLSTQNPVDLDYKAMSNAGTWMIGRLQTERDKARLLEGMSSAAGSVDVAAVDATISGLGKREFVLRRADRDEPEVFTTRWAMSYLRGPMTRDQIKTLHPEPPTAGAAAPARPSTGAPADIAMSGSVPPPVATPTPATTADDTLASMPVVADGIAVRFVDVAAPWLGDVGGDSRGTVLEPALVARVAIRYDDTKADLVHDVEHEAVLFPLGDTVDMTRLVQVDYDDRDLRTDPPTGATFRPARARIDTKSFFTGAERSLRDHLTRSLTIEIPCNTDLKLYGRPGESPEDFAGRCAAVADDRADEQIAALRSKYEARATRLRDQIEAAEDRARVTVEESKSKKNSEFFSTAGSMLGGLLGGSRSKTKMIGDLLGDAGTAARRRGSTTASERRVDAAQNKVERLVAQYEELEAELAEEVADIASTWDDRAAQVTSMTIGLERSDVVVTHLALAWIPVS